MKGVDELLAGGVVDDGDIVEPDLAENQGHRFGVARTIWQLRDGTIFPVADDERDPGLGAADINQAIQRESNMKHWTRAWKVRLILDANPNWRASMMILRNAERRGWTGIHAAMAAVE